MLNIPDYESLRKIRALFLEKHSLFLIRFTPPTISTLRDSKSHLITEK